MKIPGFKPVEKTDSRLPPRFAKKDFRVFQKLGSLCLISTA